jgi:hypothetical protein
MDLFFHRIKYSRTKHIVSTKFKLEIHFPCFFSFLVCLRHSEFSRVYRCKKNESGTREAGHTKSQFWRELHFSSPTIAIFLSYVRHKFVQNLHDKSI